MRHVQAFLMFLGLTLAYALRVNLSVAIVAMTDRHSANPDFEVSLWWCHIFFMFIGLTNEAATC